MFTVTITFSLCLKYGSVCAFATIKPKAQTFHISYSSSDTSDWWDVQPPRIFFLSLSQDGHLSFCGYRSYARGQREVMDPLQKLMDKSVLFLIIHLSSTEWSILVQIFMNLWNHMPTSSFKGCHSKLMPQGQLWYPLVSMWLLPPLQLLQVPSLCLICNALMELLWC